MGCVVNLGCGLGGGWGYFVDGRNDDFLAGMGPDSGWIGLVGSGRILSAGKWVFGWFSVGASAVFACLARCGSGFFARVGRC